MRVKTIPAQEEIRSQILIKEMSFFEATKKRPNKLVKLQHALFITNPTSVVPERVFQPRNYLSENSGTD